MILLIKFSTFCDLWYDFFCCHLKGFLQLFHQRPQIFFGGWQHASGAPLPANPIEVMPCLFKTEARSLALNSFAVMQCFFKGTEYP